MSNSKIAGTIMLNQSTGAKKFLVKELEGNYEFITTELKQDKTGLASILESLKEQVKIDIQSINLTDLANANLKEGRLPLFVFEMEATDRDPVIEPGFVWKSPSTLRVVLEQLDITGVPIFQ